MNRRLDGRKLTTDDLFAIADANGLRFEQFIGGHHLHSNMLQLTSKVRFDMWSKGNLVLDTRPDSDVQITGCGRCTALVCACRAAGAS